MTSGNAANHWRAIEEEKLRRRIKLLEKAAWKVVEEVSLPPPSDYYYSETDWVTMEELKRALLGGGDE